MGALHKKGRSMSLLLLFPERRRSTISDRSLTAVVLPRPSPANRSGGAEMTVHSSAPAAREPLTEIRHVRRAHTVHGAANFKGLVSPAPLSPLLLWRHEAALRPLCSLPAAYGLELSDSRGRGCGIFSFWRRRPAASTPRKRRPAELDRSWHTIPSPCASSHGDVCSDDSVKAGKAMLPYVTGEDGRLLTRRELQSRGFLRFADPLPRNASDDKGWTVTSSHAALTLTSPSRSPAPSPSASPRCTAAATLPTWHCAWHESGRLECTRLPQPGDRRQASADQRRPS